MLTIVIIKMYFAAAKIGREKWKNLVKTKAEIATSPIKMGITYIGLKYTIIKKFIISKQTIKRRYIQVYDVYLLDFDQGCNALRCP